jgi:hypothetical protein
MNRERLRAKLIARRQESFQNLGQTAGLVFA